MFSITSITGPGFDRDMVHGQSVEVNIQSVQLYMHRIKRIYSCFCFVSGFIFVSIKHILRGLVYMLSCDHVKTDNSFCRT